MHNGVNLEFPDDESPYYMFLDSLTKSVRTEDDGAGGMAAVLSFRLSFLAGSPLPGDLERYLLENRLIPVKAIALEVISGLALNKTTLPLQSLLVV